MARDSAEVTGKGKGGKIGGTPISGGGGLESTLGVIDMDDEVDVVVQQGVEVAAVVEIPSGCVGQQGHGEVVLGQPGIAVNPFTFCSHW